MTQIDIAALVAEAVLKAAGTSLKNYTLNGSRERIIEAARAALPTEASHLRDPDGHWGDFIWSALNEAGKAMRKFPQPNYVISKIAEEAGEVVKSAIHCAEGRETPENVRNEMRQLIAMLYRLWIEGDQVHGLLPLSTALRQIEKLT